MKWTLPEMMNVYYSYVVKLNLSFKGEIMEIFKLRVRIFNYSFFEKEYFNVFNAILQKFGNIFKI